MNVPFLAAVDIGPLITIIVIVAVIINVIRQAVRRQGQEGQPEPHEEGEARPRRPSPSDQIERFLEELAGKTGARPPERPRARPAPPRPERVEKRPPMARPAPVVGRHAPRRAPPLKREAPPAVKPVRRLVADVKEKQPPAVTVGWPDAAKRRAEVAARLDRVLPPDPLKRAVMLREMLGPSRSRRPYRPLDW